MVKVFLVDDHEVVRRGVCELLEAEPDITVVGEAGTAREAMARLPAAQPDVAVLDVRLPDGDGVTLCRDLKADNPGLVCLMLTSFGDDEGMLNAVLAGAAGYVLKDVRGNDLVKAVRTVAAGGSLLDPHAVSVLLDRIRAPKPKDPLDVLSEQERRIFALIGEGLSNREIAARMSLAEKTVKNYVSNVLGKLGMQRRTQAALLAADLRTTRGPS
ncbi:MAG: response regulator transcription factor [Actinomycetota bacterium]|nr:response regulator transcription factor [Actinomycetota bacterium]